MLISIFLLSPPTGPMCPQDTSFTKTRFPFQMRHGDYDMSEDCLRLSVYSPDTDVTAALPVMVFIHGGRFIAGTSDE